MPEQRKAMVKTHKLRRFQLTLNIVEHWQDLEAAIRLAGPIRYIIACEEEAPTTGHKHIHCYVEFMRPLCLETENLAGAHVEECKGNSQQNIDYIKKEGKVILEEGIPALEKQKAVRTETNAKHSIGTVRAAIESGDQEFLDTLPAQLYGTVQKIKLDIANSRPKRLQYPKITWLWGPTGTGKTARAIEAGATSVEYHNEFFSDWGTSTKILFDEFRGEVPYKLLLKICDRYQGYHQVNIKGGYKLLDIDEVWITSDRPPEMVYHKFVQENPQGLAELYRRIDAGHGAIIPTSQPLDIDQPTSEPMYAEDSQPQE